MDWKVLSFIFIHLGIVAIGAEYRASETEKQLNLITPYGEKSIVGDVDDTNYRIEIPLDQLEPERKQRRGINSDGTFTNSTNSKENSTVESKEKETKIIETQIIRDREPASQQAQRVIVEYDDSDRLILEANRLFNRRKLSEAASIVDELIRRKPNHVRAWVMKGSLMYIQGQKDLATTAWKQAQALEPENKDLKSILEKYK